MRATIENGWPAPLDRLPQEAVWSGNLETEQPTATTQKQHHSRKMSTKNGWIGAAEKKLHLGIQWGTYLTWWACFRGKDQTYQKNWATWGLHRLRPKFLSMIRFEICLRPLGNKFLTMTIQQVLVGKEYCLLAKNISLVL